MNEFWNKYPYTDFHEMNLDWILSRIRSMEDSIRNFINLNTIKYADPIGWDITSQYEANTVVIDNQTGNAYISTKAVPYGVHINNTDYWTQIFNYANELDTLREQIAAANEGQSTTATAPRLVDDLVWVKGELFKIISPMIAGDTYVIGSNCIRTTIENELKNNTEAINDEISERIEADELLQSNIDTEESSRIAAIQAEIENRILADDLKLDKPNTSYTHIYLSPTGNDTNDGTENNPVRTFSRAYNISIKRSEEVKVLHLIEGHYNGYTFRGYNFMLRASGNIYIDGDLVLRNNCCMLIGNESAVTRDEAVYNFGGGINGIYIHNSKLTTNCELKFSNCENAIIADCNAQFATHEWNTSIVFGENVQNGIEASRSTAFGGLYTGHVSNVGIKSLGGVITYIWSDELTAGNVIRERLDGGMVFSGNMLDDIKPSSEVTAIEYTPGQGAKDWTCPKPGFISVNTENSIDPSTGLPYDVGYTGIVINTRTHTRIGCGGYGYGRGGGEMACRSGDIIRINIDAHVKINNLEFHPDF